MPRSPLRNVIAGDDRRLSRPPEVNKQLRSAMKRQRPACIWLTGYSGAGKSTVARLLECALHQRGHHTYVLDGDEMRGRLCADLGFTKTDRAEQSRRATEVARLMVDAGLIVIVAIISPFESERRKSRQAFAKGEFIEIYIDTPLDICEERDLKGLYRKARNSEIANFTGISSPYEPPVNPELVLHCGQEAPEQSVTKVLMRLRALGVID